MAGHRRGRDAIPVAVKRAAHIARRAQGQDPAGYLAVMCDYLKAAADGKPDRLVLDAADRVRAIAEDING